MELKKLYTIPLNGENEAAMLLTVASVNVGKCVNNVQGVLGGIFTVVI